MQRALTHERLREVLDYRPPTGQFIRLVATGSRAVVGAVAGSVGKNGHRYIMIDGEKFLASRLAWFWMTGVWPPFEVDHEDLDASNDRWSNLRDATGSQNGANKPLQKNNTNGAKGVSINPTSKINPYVAWVKHKGVKRHVGVYPTLEQASAARDAEAMELFGEFYRHGQRGHSADDTAGSR